MRNKSPKANSVFLGTPQTGIKWEDWWLLTYGGNRPSKSHNTAFDFWWNDERIDLKVCELIFRKAKRGKPFSDSIGHWTFNTNSDHDIDKYICIGLVNGVPFRFFNIPFADFPKGGASITKGDSKYNRFVFKPK